ncbi:MAG: hypothetical protein J0H94_03755 [Rhizobiales bacterium]|nr:hypothetical protein [Hyphomicrobiales bacterium]
MNRAAHWAACGLLSISTAGCLSLPQRPTQALTPTLITRTVLDVKRQVQIYQDYVGYLVAHPSEDRDKQEAANRGFWCGKGSIDFEISSIKFDLTATTSTTATASAGATLPIVGAGVPGSIAPSGQLSHAATNKQQLVFTVFPVAHTAVLSWPIDISKAQIAVALIGLRKALIDAATYSNAACMADYNIQKREPTDQTFVMAIEVSDGGQAGFNVTLGVVKAGLTGEAKSVSGNTITVAFRQIGVTKTTLPGGGIGIRYPDPGLFQQTPN